MAIFNEIIENKCVNERHCFVKGNNLTNTGNWKTMQDKIKLVLFTYMKSYTGFSIGIKINDLE